jgi:hypothetical protein
VRVYATVLLAGLLALTGVLFGFWWAPFVVGLAVGAVLPPARAGIPTSGAIGLLSWLIPLAATHARYGLGPTATSLAAIMGFDHLPFVPVALTLMVGLLLGLVGGWLGSAGRAVVASNARVDATRNG